MKRSSLHSITSAAAAALFLIACSVRVAAQEKMQDHPRDEGMHGNRTFGTGIGIGIGIDIIQGLTTQGAPPAGQNTPSNGTSASHKTESKTTKRAAKKDDKTPPTPPKQQQTTDKPPPTPGTPPPTSGTPQTQTTGVPPQTTDKPPNTNNPQQPVAPPANNNPQPVAPPPTQPTAEKDCPQRGKGCAALIIDFSSRFNEKDDLKAMRNALEEIDCDVQYVDPEFRNANASVHSEQRAAAREWNDKQMKWIREEINKHRKKLEEGRELAIEMITAHGGGWEFDDDPSSTFGVFGPHQLFRNNFNITERGDSDKKQKLGEGRAGLTRGLFHAGNYTAAKKHVCAWFVFDHSCYSGLTPRAIDTLNNTGHAAYTEKPKDDCDFHAAYEEDLGVSTSKNDEMCDVNDAATATAPFIKELENFEKSIQGDSPADYRSLIAKLDNIFWASQGFYSDGGYNYCTGPTRSGYVFGPGPLPEGPHTNDTDIFHPKTKPGEEISK
jgi:outer membrane biosynthesis protein TonB